MMKIDSSTPVRVLVAGCSYAGITAVLNLLDFCKGRGARNPLPDRILQNEKALQGVPVDIHIVDERDGFLHLIGCPLAFASNEYAQKAWTRFEDVPALQHPNIRWSQASLTNIDPDRMMARIMSVTDGSEEELPYDYFIGATGLRRINPVVPDSRTREQYLGEVDEHIEKVRKVTARGDSVVIIGGGAVGIEMAAELKEVLRSAKVTLVHSRQWLLSSEPFPREFGEVVLNVLREMEIEVVMGHGRVKEKKTDENNKHTIVFEDGLELLAGMVIDAVSLPVPCTEYLPSSSLGVGGLVKIDTLLRFLPGHSKDAHHVAIGDIAAWPGVKRAGGALYMGYFAADNIHQQMLFERESIPLDLMPIPADNPPVMALAIGHKAATYSPAEGVNCSEELMKTSFQDDLGRQGFWDYSKLSQPWPKEVEVRTHDTAHRVFKERPANLVRGLVTAGV